MLVDDEVGITRTLALFLQEEGGCEVRVENRGANAMEAAREFRPHLIFMDVNMPDADGGALAAEIRSDPELRGTPVVFLTALVSRSEIGKVPTAIGGSPFLAKPVDPNVLLQCVDRFARVRD